MTDARTLEVKVHIDTDKDRFAVWKGGLGWVECELGPLLAAAAEADTLRERVAALEGWVQMLTEGSPWSEDHSCIGCGRRQYRIEPPIGQGHAADCAYINARAAIAATDQRGAVCGLDCDACRAYMEPETEGDAVLPGHPRPTQPTPEPSPSAALVEALVRDLHRLGYTSPDTRARVQAIADAARLEAAPDAVSLTEAYEHGLAAARAEGLGGAWEDMSEALSLLRAWHDEWHGREVPLSGCDHRRCIRARTLAARARRPGGEAGGGEG